MTERRWVSNNRDDQRQKLSHSKLHKLFITTDLQEDGDVLDDVAEHEVVLGGVEPAELGEPAEQRHHGLHHERLHLGPRRKVVEDVIPCVDQHTKWGISDRQWLVLQAAQAINAAVIACAA